jgi:glycosyltransferase involved in cell wall biosynthesis
MTPLRVVIVMVDAPLPFGSAPGRWYAALLKGLVERGHHVTAFAACGKPGEIEQARVLYPPPQYDLRLYPFPERLGWKSKWETLQQPFSFMFSDSIKRDLSATLSEGFDVLHIEQHWAGWLGLGQVNNALLNIHYLMRIDLSERVSSPIRHRLTRWLGFHAERRLIRAFPHIRACTPRLESAIREIHPRADIWTVPFALDTSRYEYIPDDRRAPEPRICLIGTMSWPPSLSAATRLLTRLWPEIKRRVPAVQLDIVGWDARRALTEFLETPDVRVFENVPETRPFFESASVFVYAPGRGSGMKIKIQEAMAYGVPVVTTSEGVEGLRVQDGVEAGIADDDEGLIERCVALLGDVDRQNRQRHAARAVIETQCDPGRTLDAIEALHRLVAESKQGK